MGFKITLYVYLFNFFFWDILATPFPPFARTTAISPTKIMSEIYPDPPDVTTKIQEQELELTRQMIESSGASSVYSQQVGDKTVFYKISKMDESSGGGETSHVEGALCQTVESRLTNMEEVVKSFATNLKNLAVSESTTHANIFDYDTTSSQMFEESSHKSPIKCQNSLDKEEFEEMLISRLSGVIKKNIEDALETKLNFFRTSLLEDIETIFKNNKFKNDDESGKVDSSTTKPTVVTSTSSPQTVVPSSIRIQTANVMRERKVMSCKTCCEEVPLSQFLNFNQAPSYDYNDPDEPDSKDYMTVEEDIDNRATIKIQDTTSSGVDGVDVTFPNSEEKYSESITFMPLETETFNGDYSTETSSSFTTKTNYSTHIKSSETLQMTEASITDQTDKTAPHTPKYPRDCAELYKNGEKYDGVYRIQPTSREIWTVFCDMTTDGGGWTVIQRRVDGLENFTRPWRDYRRGFGKASADHWVGLNKMNTLTASRKNKMVLRIDLEDWAGVRNYAQYDKFKIGGRKTNFKLSVDEYHGNAGDAIRMGSRFNQNNQRFSTIDRDNDQYSGGNCAEYYNSGWWFNSCFAGNLNGKYYKGTYQGAQDGIYWGTWYRLTEKEHDVTVRHSFKYADMKVRPADFFSSKFFQ